MIKGRAVERSSQMNNNVKERLTGMSSTGAGGRGAGRERPSYIPKEEEQEMAHGCNVAEN
jgi:hypothetical protein